MAPPTAPGVYILTLTLSDHTTPTFFYVGMADNLAAIQAKWFTAGGTIRANKARSIGIFAGGNWKFKVAVIEHDRRKLVQARIDVGKAVYKETLRRARAGVSASLLSHLPTHEKVAARQELANESQLPATGNTIPRPQLKG